MDGQLYDPTNPLIRAPLPLPSPPKPPNALALKVFNDAEGFTLEMRRGIQELNATRAREISSGADYLKAVETGDTHRCDEIHEEVIGLQKETTERIDALLSALKLHHQFLLEVAAVLEK